MEANDNGDEDGDDAKHKEIEKERGAAIVMVYDRGKNHQENFSERIRPRENNRIREEWCQGLIKALGVCLQVACLSEVFIKFWTIMVSNMESTATMVHSDQGQTVLRLGEDVWFLLDVSYPCWAEIDDPKPLKMASLTYIVKVAK